YNTQALPIYQYLHQEDHPKYAIADNFFQAAFGGSFLNHQWLIAAASPTWPGAPVANHSIIDSNGMPNGKTANPSYALYTPTGPVLDRQLTQLCPSVVPGLATEPCLAVLPEQGLSVPSPAVQLLRELRPRNCRADTPEGRAVLYRPGQSFDRDVQAQFGQLCQADRARERASGLYE